MAQKTAVEWLVNYMLENFHLTDKSLEVFEQAKAMEKEQIVEAFHEGMQTNFDPNYGIALNYYKSTYGKEMQQM